VANQPVDTETPNSVVHDRLGEDLALLVAGRRREVELRRDTAFGQLVQLGQGADRNQRFAGVAG